MYTSLKCRRYFRAKGLIDQVFDAATLECNWMFWDWQRVGPECMVGAGSSWKIIFHSPPLFFPPHIYVIWNVHLSANNTLAGYHPPTPPPPRTPLLQFTKDQSSMYNVQVIWKLIKSCFDLLNVYDLGTEEGDWGATDFGEGDIWL